MGKEWSGRDILIGLGALLVLVLGAIWLGPAILQLLAAGIEAAAPTLMSLLIVFAGMVLIIALAVVIAIAGMLVTMWLLRQVVAGARQHPFEALSPIVATVAGVMTSLSADAAGIRPPDTYLYAALPTLLIEAGAILVRSKQSSLQMLGTGIILLTPAGAGLAILASQPAPDLLEALSQLSTSTVGLFGAFVAATIGVGVLAWSTRDEVLS